MLCYVGLRVSIVAFERRGVDIDSYLQYALIKI